MEKEATGIIYMFVNKINNKKYIGKTVQVLEKRLKVHLKNTFQKDISTHLYLALRKYGTSNFTVKIIEDQLPESKINEREKYWIKYYNTTNRKTGYNKTLGGDGGNTWKLNTHKEETSKRLSYSIRNSEKHKKAVTSPEFRKQISECSKGRKVSDEVKQRSSKTQKKRFENPEERLKLSRAHKGKILTEEHKKNIGKAVKGRVLSKKHKERIGKGNKGKRKSKTWEEIFGIDEAKEIRKKRSQR